MFIECSQKPSDNLPASTSHPAKDLKYQVQAVIKRTGLRNISVYYMNGRSSSAIFTPPKEKQSCPTNCETSTCLVKPNKCLTKHAVSKITCSFCEKVYIGESGRTIDSRIKEHRMNKQSFVQPTTAKHPRSTVTMLIYARLSRSPGTSLLLGPECYSHHSCTQLRDLE